MVRRAKRLIAFILMLVMIIQTFPTMALFADDFCNSSDLPLHIARGPIKIYTSEIILQKMRLTI
ncbi:hypothetical protein AGMMS49975_21330 [Clostridia bacterium]|nr:hypothetical protein AGMMS49975_21330 [Clostridia bacterium]